MDGYPPLEVRQPAWRQRPTLREARLVPGLTVEVTMPQIDQPTTPAPKATAETKKPRSEAPAKPPGGIYSFTVNTADGKILTVERVDPTGQRHPLTADDKRQLATGEPVMPLRHLVEQAFEAGIECVLGEGPAKHDAESKEDGELSGILIQTLIEGGKAKELVKNERLHRAALATLIVHAAKDEGSANN